MTETPEPVTLCITYELQAGISMEEFRHWSRTVDQPAVNALPGIRKYEILEVESVDEGGDHPDVIDIVEAASWDHWLAVDDDPSTQAVAREFFDRICKEGSIRTYRVGRIEQ